MLAVVGIAMVLLIAAGAVAFVALGGDDDDAERAAPTSSTSTTEAAPTTTEAPSTTTEPELEPQRGGDVTIGVPDLPADGLCPTDGPLTEGGRVLASAVYDTLTVPGPDGTYEPHLAESVEPDDDLSTWTIALRPDVVFHDDTPLTAEVVKANLDAQRESVAGSFLLADVTGVEVTGELEVTVTTDGPWAAFPTVLHSGGQLAIMGEAQLASPRCGDEVVGTGPFVPSGTTATGVELEANRSYWAEGADGEPLPYLDSLVVDAVIEEEQRLNALESGDVDAALFPEPGAQPVLDDLAEDGSIEVAEPEAPTHLTYLRLDASEAPFDDTEVRQAVAAALDPQEWVEVVEQGATTPAAGPFPPGGEVAEPDPDGAATVLEGLGPVTLSATPGSGPQQGALFVQQALEEAGLEVQIQTVTADRLVDDSLSGAFDLALATLDVRDLDLVAPWVLPSPLSPWAPELPEVASLLAEARIEPDADARAQLVQQAGEAMVEGAWGVPLSWTTTPWAAAVGIEGTAPATLWLEG